MAKEIFYRQCTLKRKVEQGTEETTSWLPEQFSEVGMVLKLKGNDGTWVDGWVVQSAAGRMSEQSLPDAHKSIKNHRRNTGDSQPKRI